MHITKVFNNNVALVDDGGTEVVVMGLGIAFGRRAGDTLDPAAVERRFEGTERSSASQLAAHLRDISVDVVGVAEELITRGRAALGPHVDQRILVPLADHIDAAIRRLHDGFGIEYPLADEVRHLYPAETALGDEAVELVAERLGVHLPPIEAVPLALHFVNAQFGGTAIGEMVRMTDALRGIFTIIRMDYAGEIDETSLDASRFTAHLRYLFLRRRRGEPERSEIGEMLGSTVRDNDPKAHRTATRVAEFLQRAQGWDVGEDEVLYLALHIHRLTTTPQI
jgi:beta-glucoside operon transcriptional antiterminator